MELKRWFKGIRFSPETLQSATSVLRHISGDKYAGRFEVLEIAIENSLWKYDEFDEFLANLPKADGARLYYWVTGTNGLHYSLNYDGFCPDNGSSVALQCSTQNEIAATMDVFDVAARLKQQ